MQINVFNTFVRMIIGWISTLIYSLQYENKLLNMLYICFNIFCRMRLKASLENKDAEPIGIWCHKITWNENIEIFRWGTVLKTSVIHFALTEDPMDRRYFFRRSWYFSFTICWSAILLPNNLIKTCWAGWKRDHKNRIYICSNIKSGEIYVWKWWLSWLDSGWLSASGMDLS